jgi:hypothetical protein
MSLVAITQRCSSFALMQKPQASTAGQCTAARFVVWRFSFAQGQMAKGFISNMPVKTVAAQLSREVS